MSGMSDHTIDSLMTTPLLGQQTKGRLSSKLADTPNNYGIGRPLCNISKALGSPRYSTLMNDMSGKTTKEKCQMTLWSHASFSLRPTMSPDFVIKKKRKRTHAVDPCLGFYSTSHSSTIPQLFTKQSSISTAHDVPPITTLSPAPFLIAPPDSAHASSEIEDSSEHHGIVKVVTVDEFLRRSAEKKPTKSYRRRKRRAVDLGGPTSDLEETYSPPASPDSKNIKIIQAPRKKVKLAGRLVRAAVLAHVDPTESLRRRRDSNIGESTRKPLRFVNETHSPVKTISRGRTVTLVDPRKIAPFHEPYFSVHTSQSSLSVMNTRKQKPITKWKSACHWSSPSNNSRAVKTKASVVREKTSARIPLSFIPLEDAEKAYSSKRDHSSKLHLTVLERPPKTLSTPLLFSALQMQEDQTPDRPSKRIKHSSSAFSPLSRTLVTPLACTRTSPSQDGFSSFPAPTTYKNSSAPQHGSSPDLPTALRIRPSDPSDELKAEPGSKKPLKALASFLGSFLETARNATQMQVKPSSRSSVKRKRTNAVRTTDEDTMPYLTHEDATEERSRILPVSRQKPLKSMRSFIETSVQTPGLSVVVDAHQPPLPAGHVLLRTLTARSRLLLKSVKSQTTTGSVSYSVANTLPHSSSHSHVAAYVNHAPAAKVTESQPVSSNVPLNYFSSSLQPTVPNSHALLSSLPSPQRILAALQPPKAQIVLSSTPTLPKSPNAQLSVNSC